MKTPDTLDIFKRIRDQFLKWEKTSYGQDLLCSGWAYLTVWRTLCLGRITVSRLGAFKVSHAYKFSNLVRELASILLANAPVLHTAPELPSSRRIFLFSWYVNNGTEDHRDNYLGELGPDLADHVSRVNVCIPPVAGSFDHNRDAYFVFKRTLAWNIIWFINALVKTMFGLLSPERWLANWSVERRNAVYMTRQLAKWFDESAAMVETIIFPYEQQPWQCEFIRYFKNKYPAAKIVGYIHSSLNNVPTQFVKQQFSPDVMFVHGSAYKRVMGDVLGWNPERIHLIESLRFLSPLKIDRSTIFLPYSFTERDIILSSIKSLVDSGVGLRGADIRLHPIKRLDPGHLNLKRQIEDILKISTDSTKIAAITVGVSTVTLEALEADYEVFSIFENPEKDSLHSDFWNEIEMRVIHPYCFQYRIPAKGAFIKLRQAHEPIRTIIGLSESKTLLI